VNNSVGAGVKAFEWSILGRIDSASLVSQSVGVYGQASAVAPGVQVWGSVSEARDDEGHNAILVGQEVDIVGGAKSIGIDLVAYNAPQNMTGIRIGPASGSNFPLDTGIAFKGAYATAAITVPAAGTQMTWIFMSEDKSVGLGIAVVGGQQRICIYSRQQCTIF